MLINDSIIEHTYYEKTQNYQNIIFNLCDFISVILEKTLYSGNKNKKNILSKKTIFDIKKIPKISIKKYIRRIVKYAKPEPSSLISALIYLDKICETQNIVLTKKNIYKLLLICIMLSMKFNEDDVNSNAFFAKVGGIDLENLNPIENQTYKILNFEFFIDDNLFHVYEDYIELFMNQ